MTSTEPTIAPAPGKSCGECMLCCKLPALAPLDKPMLIAVSATLLLSWLLMTSQAMESITRYGNAK